jgi:hypothetical protein
MCKHALACETHGLQLVAGCTMRTEHPETIPGCDQALADSDGQALALPAEQQLATSIFGSAAADLARMRAIDEPASSPNVRHLGEAAYANVIPLGHTPPGVWVIFDRKSHMLVSIHGTQHGAREAAVRFWTERDEMTLTEAPLWLEDGPGHRLIAEGCDTDMVVLRFPVRP